MVALTFDCGSDDAAVSRIVETLQAQGVPATFFLTGRWVERFPSDAKRIAASFRVGDHTYSHPHLTQYSDAGVRDEITHGASVVTSVTGRDTHPLLRFPYGDRDQRTLRIAASLGYVSIYWAIDTLGWQGKKAGRSVDSVVNRVVGGLRPGAIVLMHVGTAEDGTTLDADALPQIIAAVRAHGYGFAEIRL